MEASEIMTLILTAAELWFQRQLHEAPAGIREEIRVIILFTRTLILVYLGILAWCKSVLR